VCVCVCARARACLIVCDLETSAIRHFEPSWAVMPQKEIAELNLVSLNIYINKKNYINKRIKTMEM